LKLRSVMVGEKDFADMSYQELIELLSRLTKQYTAELVRDRRWETEDDKIYNINVLIKEIELREDRHRTLNRINNIKTDKFIIAGR